MNIFIIIGLPGSGKSHFCKSLQTSLFNVLDDLQILDGLPDTKDERILVLSSPNYCYPATLKNCKEHLRERYPACTINCIYFENDPDKCVRNTQYRNDGRKVEQSIKLMSVFYEIPDTIEPLKIWQPEEKYYV